MLIDGWFPFIGGGQVHVQNLTQVLSKKYHYQFILFYPSQTDIISRLIWSIWVIPAIIFASFKTRPSIIHSHGFICGLPAKIASLLLSVPVVHTVHGSHLMDLAEKSPKAYLEKFLLTKIKYSAQISVSQSFTQYQNHNSQLHIIRNGVNLTAFDKTHPAKSTHPTILCVARNHPHKGLKYLLQAFKIAKKSIPQLELKLISNLPLSDKLRATIYKKAHLFVLPSLAEGQPITLMEAWAARLPVVVTRVGDNPFLVKSGINGFLVDSKSSRQLAHKIVHLLHHPKIAKRIGQAGYQLVKHQYTWDHVAKQTHQVYQHLLQ